MNTNTNANINTMNNTLNTLSPVVHLITQLNQLNIKFTPNRNKDNFVKDYTKYKVTTTSVTDVIYGSDIYNTLCYSIYDDEEINDY